MLQIEGRWTTLSLEGSRYLWEKEKGEHNKRIRTWDKVCNFKCSVRSWDVDKNWKRGSQITGSLGQECPWQRQKLEQRSLTAGQWGHIRRFPGEVKRERGWLTNYRHNEESDSPGTLQRLLTSFPGEARSITGFGAQAWPGLTYILKESLWMLCWEDFIGGEDAEASQ